MHFRDWCFDPPDMTPEEREALDDWACVPDEPYEHWRDERILAEMDD